MEPLRLIAHRGNISGPNPEKENHPDYIKAALDAGYEVEVDVWFKNEQWFTGHDDAQYEVDFQFLWTPGLWIHCKHYAALRELVGTRLNFFYHTDEDYVLTSHSYIWAYPGQPGNWRTICVMPERTNQSALGFAGVCSDFVKDYS